MAGQWGSFSGVQLLARSCSSEKDYVSTVSSSDDPRKAHCFRGLSEEDTIRGGHTETVPFLHNTCDETVLLLLPVPLLRTWSLGETEGLQKFRKPPVYCRGGKLYSFPPRQLYTLDNYCSNE